MASSPTPVAIAPSTCSERSTSPRPRGDMRRRSSSPRPAGPVRQRRDHPDGRGSGAAAALALRSLEAGSGGVRPQLVGRARRAERRHAPRQHLRPAPDAARRGGRGRDLLLPACRPASRARSTATARRRAITYMCSMLSLRYARRAAAAASTTSAPASRRTSPRSMRASPRQPARPPNLRLQTLRPGELRRSCLDASHARSELGWAPQIAVAEGLAEHVRGDGRRLRALPRDSDASLACRKVASATIPLTRTLRFPPRSSPAGPAFSAPTSAKRCSAAATACSASTTSKRGR